MNAPATKRRVNPLADSRPVGRMVCIVGAFVLGGIFAVLAIAWYRSICIPLDEGRVICAAIANSPPWTLLTSIAAVPALGLTWWWRTVHKDQDIGQKQIELDLARREERSKRFAEAVRMLADEKLEVRLGAIYSLESLAADAADERLRVARTLAAFLKLRGVDQVQPLDIEAAFNIIGTIPDVHGLDLNSAKLLHVQATCKDWKLPGADFRGAQLMSALLHNIDLSGTNLSKANFNGAILSMAKLNDASIVMTQFRGTNLRGADLRRATIKASDFNGARFDAQTKFPEGFDPHKAGMELDTGEFDVELWNTVSAHAPPDGPVA